MEVWKTPIGVRRDDLAFTSPDIVDFSYEKPSLFSRLTLWPARIRSINVRALAQMFPIYWHQFVENHQLAGKSACLSEEVDLSTLGADMRFLNEARSIDELTNFWPGLGVSKDGYVPVASCLIGSGDYYYINTNDGQDGPLYRLYHDAVGPNGYKTEDAVARVLNHYEELLRHVES